MISAFWRDSLLKTHQFGFLEGGTAGTFRIFPPTAPDFVSKIHGHQLGFGSPPSCWQSPDALGMFQIRPGSQNLIKCVWFWVAATRWFWNRFWPPIVDRHDRQKVDWVILSLLSLLFSEVGGGRNSQGDFLWALKVRVKGWDPTPTCNNINWTSEGPRITPTYLSQICCFTEVGENFTPLREQHGANSAGPGPSEWFGAKGNPPL